MVDNDLNKKENGAWAGGSVESVRTALVQGDPELVASSRPLVDRFSADAARFLDTLVSQTALAPVGTSVSIGAYLAGLPACMRRQEPALGRGPLTLAVNVGGRASVDPQHLKMRGLAAFALAQALQIVRPVRLIAYRTWDPGKRTACAVSVEAESSPFDLSAAGYMLAHPAFFRRFLLGAGYAISPGLRTTPRESAEEDRAIFGWPADAVILPYASTEEFAKFETPDAAMVWIRAKLESALAT